MIIGRVSGNVVATLKHPLFHAHKLLLVDHLNLDGTANGRYDICVDMAQAGVGDTVLVLDEGTGARQVLGQKTGPVRAVIVGIIDAIDLTE